MASAPPPKAMLKFVELKVTPGTFALSPPWIDPLIPDSLTSTVPDALLTAMAPLPNDRFTPLRPSSRPLASSRS